MSVSTRDQGDVLRIAKNETTGLGADLTLGTKPPEQANDGLGNLEGLKVSFEEGYLVQMFKLTFRFWLLSQLARRVESQNVK